MSGKYGVTGQQIKTPVGGLQVTAPDSSGIPFKFGDSGSIDAFGRLRMSNPSTIFDSKQIHDNQDLFWDEELISGGGITSSHSSLTASTTIQSTANTAGVFIRQTFQRFNYQPGKSQLILLTGVLQPDSISGTGLEREIGYHDDNNGLFFKESDGVVSIVRRTNVTGTPTDNLVAQANWNLDPLDGTGPSGITIDWSKTQIFTIDFEWLGVGRVRMGVVIDGMIIYTHQFNNANTLGEVYMSTPNLPIRYKLNSTTDSPAGSLDCICSTIISEGGQDVLGITRTARSGAIAGLSSANSYALIGIRLKTTHIGTSILPNFLSILTNTPNDIGEWVILLNPTIAGTFTFSPLASSAIEVAVGNNTNIATGGLETQSGLFSTSQLFTGSLSDYRRIGAAINGDRDILVLACRPITATIDVHSTMSWLEQS